MEDPEDFEAVFGAKPDLAYQQLLIEQIIRCRRSLENELFFDKLLNAVKIDQGIFYRHGTVQQVLTSIRFKSVPPKVKPGSPKSL